MINLNASLIKEVASLIIAQQQIGLKFESKWNLETMYFKKTFFSQLCLCKILIISKTQKVLLWVCQQVVVFFNLLLDTEDISVSFRGEFKPFVFLRGCSQFSFVSCFFFQFVMKLFDDILSGQCSYQSGEPWKPGIVRELFDVWICQVAAVKCNKRKFYCLEKSGTWKTIVNLWIGETE